ncbi:MAG: HAD-IIB family hydrolase [Clostridia bacterium]|nr:HAD-IIB family hydrolase [Clostridia bacterium]
MGKFDNIIVVSDLDGTFFDDDSRPAKNNLDAVKYFTQNGGLFGFSSGRNAGILKEIIPEAVMLNNIPSILSNGAYLYDFKTDTRTEELLLHTEKIKALTEEIEKRSSIVGFRWDSPEGFITYNNQLLSEFDFKEYRNRFPEYSRDYVFSQKLYKVVVCSDEKRIMQIKDYLPCLDDTSFSYTLTAPTSLEIMHCDATKGKALTKLKNILGLPHATVYAMGDYDNDYDMLLAADVAVCPSNALESIKQISDIVLCSNNQGLFDVLIKTIEKDIL